MSRGVRKDLVDQIHISRELTAKKLIDESDSDDNENENVHEEVFDPFNPCLKNQLLGSYWKYWLGRKENDIKLREYQNDENETINIEEERASISHEKTKSTVTKSKVNLKL